jgi:hypothetical protein
MRKHLAIYKEAFGHISVCAQILSKFPIFFKQWFGVSYTSFSENSKDHVLLLL